jgi:hypothetical protein
MILINIHIKTFSIGISHCIFYFPTAEWVGTWVEGVPLRSKTEIVGNWFKSPSP